MRACLLPFSSRELGLLRDTSLDQILASERYLDMGSTPSKQPKVAKTGKGKLEAWLQKKAFMLCVRLILGAATVGASEAIMLPLDLADTAFDAAEVLDCCEMLETCQEASDFEELRETIEETHEVYEDIRENIKEVKHGAKMLKKVGKLLQSEGKHKVKGKEVAAVVKREVHCSECGAVGVNKRSHKRGHPQAMLHKF